MSSIRTVARSIALALSLAVAAAPAAALADDSGSAAPADAKGGQHGKRRGEEQGKKGKRGFPVEAAKFQKMVEKRISKAREKVERVMEKRGVPEATRAQIRKELEAGAVFVRAAAQRAGADGSVTREEAQQVRDLAKDLKQKAREKLGAGKGKRKDA